MIWGNVYANQSGMDHSSVGPSSVHVSLPPVEPVNNPSPDNQPSQLSVIDFNEDMTIGVSKAEAFYKVCLYDRDERLRKNLVEGVDVGALKAVLNKY